MARRAKGTRRPPAVPRIRRREPEDGIELSDEQLEYVVGGLEPEAWRAYADFIRQLDLRRPVD